MDPARYPSSVFGQADREAGNRGASWFFRPTEIPRDLELSLATVDALSQADAALGQLQGLGRLVRDPELLIGPYIRREAVSSSRIEGTEASLSDVLRAEAGGDDTGDEGIAEIERYIAATRHGLTAIETLPISRRLVCEVNRVLLQSVRGEEKLPGEFRRTPVWVGSTARRQRPSSRRFPTSFPTSSPTRSASSTNRPGAH